MSIETSRYFRYLDQLEIPLGDFAPSHVDFVRDTIKLVEKTLGFPVSMPTSDGGIQMAWTKDHDHLSLDIYSNGHVDWFYRNRASDEVHGGEFQLVATKENS